MTRLTPVFAVLLAFGFAAPALTASQSSAQSAAQMQSAEGTSQDKLQQSQFMPPHRMVIGTVIDIRGVQIKGPMGDKHRLLKVSVDDNTVIIDLGPMKKGAFQDLGINPGNRIWVLGSSARINGKPVIYARYVGEVYDFEPNYPGEQSAA